MKFEIEYEIEEVICWRIRCDKSSDTPLGPMVGYSGNQAIYQSKHEAERVAEALNMAIACKIGEHL